MNSSLSISRFHHHNVRSSMRSKWLVGLLLICFGLTKGFVPSGFMPGNAEQGEWLVLCTVNGPVEVLVGGAEASETAGHSDQGFAMAQGDHCSFSTLYSVAFPGSSHPELLPLDERPLYRSFSSVFHTNDVARYTSIRAPPVVFS